MGDSGDYCDVDGCGVVRRKLVYNEDFVSLVIMENGVKFIEKFFLSFLKFFLLIDCCEF